MSSSPYSDTAWPRNGPKRQASLKQRLRKPFALRGQNLWYAIMAVWMLSLLGQLWYESTQVAPSPTAASSSTSRKGA